MFAILETLKVFSIISIKKLSLNSNSIASRGKGLKRVNGGKKGIKDCITVTIQQES
jgi:hypothetical protein